MRRNKGITLIALIITIIILLILVGVSLNLLIKGDLFGSAEKAVTGTNAKVNEEQSRVDELMGILEDVENENNGQINWNKILEKFKNNPETFRHPEQSSDKEDIGIGTDGKPVNMDLWEYSITNDGTGIGLGEFGECGTSIAGYSNENINEDGTIIGKVPQYIFIKEKGKIYTVTEMNVTFLSCTRLKISPEIPTTVKSLYNTFAYCSNLEKAPKIPTSVINMNGTFDCCTNLTQAPEIPPSVADMYATFYYCTNLTQAPEIPPSVTDMDWTFCHCTNLTGKLIINASPEYYTHCLWEAASAKDAKLIVTGNSTCLDDIIATKSENSNIEKGE